MEAETHPDPFQEAMTHGLQRACKSPPRAVTAAQVYVITRKQQARTVAERTSEHAAR